VSAASDAYVRELRARMPGHARQRAEQFRDRVALLHVNAPRGGGSLNRFAERRSAPGEVSAPETRALLRLIRASATEAEPGRFRVIVNYRVLEDGGRNVAPRPTGRLALAQFEATVSAQP
jgi:hypothetical protein